MEQVCPQTLVWSLCDGSVLSSALLDLDEASCFPDFPPDNLAIKVGFKGSLKISFSEPKSFKEPKKPPLQLDPGRGSSSSRRKYSTLPLSHAQTSCVYIWMGPPDFKASVKIRAPLHFYFTLIFVPGVELMEDHLSLGEDWWSHPVVLQIVLLVREKAASQKGARNISIQDYNRCRRQLPRGSYLISHLQQHSAVFLRV